MDIKTVINEHINSENFQGIMLTSGEQVEVHWWNSGDSNLNRFFVDFKIPKSVSFSCVDGKLRILD